VLDAESLGDQLAEAASAEGLGGVVARGEEVDRRLASSRPGGLVRLAGDHRVEPSAAASSRLEAPPPETMPTSEPRPALLEGERLTARQPRKRAESSPGEIGSAATPMTPIAEPAISAKRPPARAEPLAEERVVTYLRMGVERRW